MGSNVAVLPINVTCPGTAVVPVFRLNELATAEACTGSLNVAVSEDARTTPVAPLEGLVSPATVGGVVSPEMLALVTVTFALAPSVLVKD